MERFIKFVALALIVIMLVGCGGDIPVTDTDSDDSSAESSEDTTEEESSAESSEEPVVEGVGKLTALTLTAQDNPTLAQDISFAINEEERTAVLTLNYQTYADLATLQAAKISGEAEDGTLSFPQEGEGGFVDLTADALCRVTDSEEHTKDYKLVLDRTVYKLPIVNITLAGGKTQTQIDRNITTPMTFSLDCTGDGGFESLGNVSGKIRGRGNSTWKWEKKPYKIKLDEKASLLGMDSNRDWVLLANYADKSLIRNTLAYDMGRVLDNIVWSPHQYPVDLFVNGKYCGVYSLGEHMEVAKGRVEIEEGSFEVDTDYLLEIGGMPEVGSVEGYHYFHSDDRLVRFAAFKSPDCETITQAQKNYIKAYFDKAEDAIKAGVGYEEYIDVDSFVDWIILQELTNNIDACFRRSCFLVKEKGGKLRMGPIWDYDLDFGNFLKDTPSYNTWVTVGSKEAGAYVQQNWCTYLMQSPEFCKRLEARWNEVRQQLLSVADATITEYSEKLDGSEQENFAIWQIWDKRAGYQAEWCSKANSYEGQIQYLRDFITKRAAWLDGEIKKLPH